MTTITNISEARKERPEPGYRPRPEFVATIDKLIALFAVDQAAKAA